MSRTLKIALVAEGITDYEVLSPAIELMLGGQAYDLKLLQPEGSVAFDGAGNAGPLGGGWRGVYQWCLQSTQRSGGNLSGDPLFFNYDLLLLHLDADVASEDPASFAINPIPELAGVLPCDELCPPPKATTDPLREVLLSWVGEASTPPRTVLCTPSKSTEAWVMRVFFPNDSEMRRRGWECHPEPETRLGQQRKRQRFSKSRAAYAQRKAEFQEGWPRVVKALFEARRFQDEFTAAVCDLPD